MAAQTDLLPAHKSVGSKADELEPKSRTVRKMSPSRLFLYVLAALFFMSALYKPITHCYGRVSGHVCQKYMSYEGRARRILAHTPLIDGHIDFPVAMRAFYHNQIDNKEWRQAFEDGTLPGHVDLARLRHGQTGGAFWSVYAPCPTNGDDFSDENLAASVQFTLDQIDVMDRIMASYPLHFASRVNSQCAKHAFRNGKLISPLGIEGLHQIGNSASNLRRFHELGVRYATLTHNCHNKFADAAVLENPSRKAEPKWNGVSPLGRKLIHEMNRIGMIVDLSHVSSDTMSDVLGGRDDWAGSMAPVIFSHSSVYAICPHPRNVNDDILKLVKERNSVVMINIHPGFISCIDNGNDNGLPDDDDEHGTLERVVEHIMYIGNLIGYDHVGIGSDFDGIPKPPAGLEDVSKYPNLIAALLRAGVSDRDAAKVAGANLLRVWQAVDAVSAKMQAEGAPVLEDERGI